MVQKKNTKLESAIEKYLRKQIEAVGGWCPKWTSPGTTGVPDRIVFMPNGLVCFVEMKREKGGVSSSMQEYRCEVLRKLGQKCMFINTKEQVDLLVQSLLNGEVPHGV